MIGTEYYIDPQSESNIELGTLEHPFHALDDPFRELFNFAVELGVELNITVNIKHGSNVTLHSVDMPIFMLNMNFLI